MRTTAVAAAVAVLALAPRAGLAAGPAPAPSGEITVPADHAVDIVLPDGVAVTLEPGTRGRWLPRTKLPSETNTWALGYDFVLAQGEIEVRMPPGPRGSHAFLVTTPEGTLTDWRGKLHVSVHGGATAAAIYAGALVVGASGQGFPVYDGAGVLMRDGLAPDKTRPIPAGVEWDEGASAPLTLAAAGKHATLEVAWKPVRGAVCYHVTVASDAAMTRVLDVATTLEPRYALVERGAGAHYWTRVRAVSADGIVGEWSAPRPSRVVHFELPEGAFVAHDGTVVLRREQTVSLAGADGLEAAYTTPTHGGAISALYWQKAGDAIGLPYGEDPAERLVHLRQPGAAGEVTLRLARRQLRADIEVTPKDARAGDALEVRALVWDPTGRVDAAGEPVTLRALLDLDPIPVAWRRTGNAWTGHIPRRSLTGPTVIRIVASDARGVEIGRGFLELAGPTASRP